MITIDLESSEPLFNQLISQIKQAIKSKELRAGDALPSIRKLASELDVNAKTVAKAYQLLERDQVIQSKGYRGSFVHPNALENIDFDINKWLEQQVSKDIARYREMGATDSEIRIAFTHMMSS